MVALSGRVPVKVSIENGIIRTGDLLTSSSLPGVAMRATKAGQIIGQAMMPFEGDGIGLVLAFVKTDYANGTGLADLLDIQNQGILQNEISPLALTYFMEQREGLLESGDLSEILTDRLTAGLEVITPKLIADEIFAKTIHADQIEGLTFLANQIISEQFTQAQNVLDVQTATDSAVLGSADTNLEVDSLIASKGITVSGLAKFMDGVTFNGAVSYLGDVFFERTPTFNNDTAGFAVIKEGSSEVRVDFAEEYIDIPVVSATPIWDADKPTVDTVKQLGAYVLPKQEYIVASIDRKGFTIVLGEPAVTDLKFSWFALAVKGARTINGATPEPTVIPTPIPTETPMPSVIPTPLIEPSPVM